MMSMTDSQYLQLMIDQLMIGQDIVDDKFINERTSRILETQYPTENDITDADNIIKISNVLFNYTDRPILPLDNGIYDLLMVWIQRYKINYQVGAMPAPIQSISQQVTENEQPLINPIIKLEPKKGMTDDQMIFKDNIMARRKILSKMFLETPMFKIDPLKKQNVNTPHKYPKLVGTLDKCKFVINQQAIDKGVFGDANVQVFERDFIHKLLDQGVITPDQRFGMVLELKYDGVSVEAEVSDRVITALSRGDTNNNIATNLTPVLKGYKFFKAEGIIDPDDVFGMKFEAMLSNLDLSRLGRDREKTYKNPRNAMTGLLGASDANRWIDYITLVPLATSLDMNRIDEIEFMNKYYDSGEMLRYAVIEGTYQEILYQVKRFADEAEYLRPIMPYIYDGIVCSFIDKDIIDKLGRVNSVNKWQMAIKFNPQKAITVFYGYTFSVAQNGVITPVAHYKPVELFGCTHSKTTVHSYERFMKLSLKEGDIVSIELINDVIPYINNMDIKDNEFNPNEVIPFPENCPSCGSKLVLSKTGKTAMCPNHRCPGRALSIVVNMFAKIGFKDFSEESIKAIGTINNLSDLLNITIDDVRCLGDTEGQNFMNRLEEFRTIPIPDYRIVGALGFTDVATQKWKLILNKIPIPQIITNEPDLRNILLSIKGIGPSTADTIVSELDVFADDLRAICNMPNIIWTYGIKLNKKIRFTGVRDKALTAELSSLGYDIAENGVPLDTDILLVPDENYVSDKTKKVSKDCIIIDIDTFKANRDLYL